MRQEQQTSERALDVVTRIGDDPFHELRWERVGQLRGRSL